MTIQSMTDSSKSYHVEVRDGVAQHCECKAWQYGKGRSCKHMRAAQIQIERDNERQRARYHYGYDIA